MANWIKGAIKHPGALHAQMGIPKGKKIPAKKLAVVAKKGGVLGQRARLAEALKKFHIVLIFLLGASFAQAQYAVHPIVSPITVDSLIVVLGNDTVWALNDGDLDSSDYIGQTISSPYFPIGTKVSEAISGDNVLIMSNKATTTDSLAKINFSVFQSHAYAAGDAMGMPFSLGSWSEIDKIVVIDDAKQITSVDLILFDSQFAATVDSAAFAPSDADAEHMVSYMTIGGTGYNKALGANTVMVTPWTNQPQYFGAAKTLYGQLVTVGTPTFTAITNLTVKIFGR